MDKIEITTFFVLVENLGLLRSFVLYEQAYDISQGSDVGSKGWLRDNTVSFHRISNGWVPDQGANHDHERHTLARA